MIEYVRRISDKASGDVKAGDVYDTVYLVKSSIKNENPATVALAFGIPRLYSKYVQNNQYDPTVVCTKIAPEQRADTPNYWDVSCHFEVANPSTGNQSDGPGSWVPEVSFSFVKTQEPCYYDIESGEPICNSTGDLFQPPVMRDAHRLQVSIGGYASQFPINLACQMQDAVNSDTIWGIEPGRAKVVTITGNWEIINKAIWWKIKVVIEFNGGQFGWLVCPVDKGVNNFVERATGKILSTQEAMGKSIFEYDKRRIKGATAPVFLDGNGKELDLLHGDLPTPPNNCPTNGGIKGWNVYFRKPFSSMNLPDLGTITLNQTSEGE